MFFLMLELSIMCPVMTDLAVHDSLRFEIKKVRVEMDGSVIADVELSYDRNRAGVLKVFAPTLIDIPVWGLPWSCYISRFIVVHGIPEKYIENKPWYIPCTFFFTEDIKTLSTGKKAVGTIDLTYFFNDDFRSRVQMRLQTSFTLSVNTDVHFRLRSRTPLNNLLHFYFKSGSQVFKQDTVMRLKSNEVKLTMDFKKDP